MKVFSSLPLGCNVIKLPFKLPAHSVIVYSVRRHQERPTHRTSCLLCWKLPQKHRGSSTRNLWHSKHACDLWSITDFRISALPPDRYTFFCRRRTISNVLFRALRGLNWADNAGFVYARFAVQKATLLDWTSAGSTRERSTVVRICSTIAAAIRAGRAQVRDVLWERVLAANGGDTTFGSFASFRKGIVARIEIFTLLMVC